MRGELARPGLQFLSNEQYNQLFTMHGTVMLLRPAFELHYPHMVERMRAESHVSITKPGPAGIDKTTDKVLAPTDRDTEH